ncbi:MAG TPA: hypothetical protein EYP04_11060 [Anaerolineae bacterium]|nr:hypothetical protein [Anaerolineae bacterium]
MLIALGAPPRPLVVIGPPQTVRTINPKIGVHTRLTDEVEEWKIQRTLQLVREMGAVWVVEYFPWAYLEPKQGEFHWNHADLVVDHARAQGLTVVARLGFVPEWARPKDTIPSYLDPDQYAAFGDFVYAFVRHFQEQINYLVIWNEPNLSLEWGYRPVDPEAYVALLRVAFTRAKEANPNVKILAGALAPTLAPPDSEWGMNDLDFLQRVYDAGAASYFDMLAVHAYGWTFPPDDPPAPDVVNFARTELLHQVMARNGDDAKHILITEAGWNDHPRWTKAVRPGQRITYTIRAYQKALEEWDWVDAVVMWAFRYPWDMRTYQDYYTFVTVDFRLKPIYLEVQRYARGEAENTELGM